MNKSTKILMSSLLFTVISLNLALAMSVSSIQSVNFQPGSEQTINLKIKNTLSADAKAVSITLDTTTLPFAVLDYDDSQDIDEDEDEKFDVRLRAANDATAKDYQVPYTISYFVNGTSYTKNGTVTLTVEANPDLTFNAVTENSVVGSKGKIKMTIVNKGFGDAKFFSIKLIPDGYSLVSEDNQYIGTVSSDDTETATFDVIFTSIRPNLKAQIEYRDFNNEKITTEISLPITAYSKEDALKMGLIKPDNTFLYVALSIVSLVVWIIYRNVKKKRRMNKAQGR